MSKRMVSIWFRYLKTDWYSRRNPGLRHVPFVLASPNHGRMVIVAANRPAEKAGIHRGMTLADARTIDSEVQVIEEKQDPSEKLLQHIAAWCIRFSPFAAVDLPDGIILDATGCAHLWGNETAYLQDIHQRFGQLGYSVRPAMADTIGMAWATARFNKEGTIIEPGAQQSALMELPPEALRLEPGTVQRLYQLGLDQVGEFMQMPRSALRRRFGNGIITRLQQALGKEEESLLPVIPVEPYQERLPAFDPVATRAGIEIALQQLLQQLCARLEKEGKGIRQLSFAGYRVDNTIQSLEINTIKPSFRSAHLFTLFEPRIETIEPALGIELFTLTAGKVENIHSSQEQLWNGTGGLQDTLLAELLDRLTGKLGAGRIARYLPQEQHWPENSFKTALSLDEKPSTGWGHTLRPLQLLAIPEPIDVTAPIPDYPPMLFRYKGKLHQVITADGPERIEQEWWLQKGEHRDYYCVEDENGNRYWVFRSGHYTQHKKPQWFIHGFFA